MHLNIQLIIISLWSLIVNVVTVPPIYSPSTIFSSSYHSFGFLNTGFYPIPITTSSIQTNIIKTALSIAEISKRSSLNIRFKAVVNPLSTTTNQFNVDLNIYGSGLRIGFFLIVINQQLVYQCIDLVKINTTTGSNLNNHNNNRRTSSSQINIATSTIFSSTDNCQLIPIISYYNMHIGLDGSNPQLVDVNLQAFITNNTFIQNKITLQKFTRIQQFGNFILIINRNNIINAFYYNQIYDYSLDNFKIGKDNFNTWNIKTKQPSYSSPVQSKCFIGSKQLKYNRAAQFNYTITVDANNQYLAYSQPKNQNEVLYSITSFCFGFNPICLTGTILNQLPTRDCVIPGGCTLPIPSALVPSYNLKCPKCVDIICQYCKNNRYDCLSCQINTFSYLNTTTQRCVCDLGYYGKDFNLSVESIIWVTRTRSLQTCIINCTYHISQCLIDSCTNQTVCYDCFDNFFPNVVNLTHTDCKICDYFIPNCTDCINMTACGNCSSGYFQNTPNTTTTLQIQCALCLDYIDHCLTCQNQDHCLTCQTTFGVNRQLLCSQCSFLHGTNCLTCINYDICTSCLAPTILFQNGCRYCNQYIPHCTLCQLDTPLTNFQCIQCDTQYFLKNITTCIRCFIKINNCYTCSNQNTCTQCQYPYKLTSLNNCNQCQSGYLMYFGYCIKQAGCRVMTYTNTSSLSTDDKCIDCFSEFYWIYNTSTHQCQCQEGFQQQPIFLNGLTTSICVVICGDGIYKNMYQQCDDNNRIPNDGCSSQCKVQTDYKCFHNITAQITIKCILYKTFTSLKYNYAYRQYGSYKGYLSYSIYPSHIGLTTLNWSNYLSLNLPSTHLKPFSYSFNPLTGELLIQLEYFKDLQNQYITAVLTFDPQLIITSIPSLTSISKINGINAPLIIQGQSFHLIAQIIQMVFLGLVILYWIHFFIASLLNKMIGLETMQILQSVYFLRLLIYKQKSSLLIASNTLKYSNGYSNIQFITQNTQMGTAYTFSRLITMNQELIQIGLMKQFLMNLNWSLIPILIIMIVYAALAILRRYYQSQYIDKKKSLLKEKYVFFCDWLQWFYQHFVFPFLLQCQFITIFSAIQAFTSSQLTINLTVLLDDFSTISLLIHVIIFCVITFIYCSQIHKSYRSIFDIEPYKAVIGLQSPIQRLQTAKTKKLQQYIPSHHQLYIFVYLIYYLIIMIFVSLQVMFGQLNFLVEILLGIAMIYFIIICKWSPYQQDLSIHNHFLKVNHFCVILFIVIISITNKMNKLADIFYESFTYFTIILLIVVLILGYIRLFIHYKYLKVKLQTQKRIFQQQQYQLEKFYEKKQKQQRRNKFKKSNLYLQNPYLFDNQLKDMKRQYKGQCSDSRKLTQTDKSFIKERMQQQNQQKYFKQICHGQFDYKPKNQQKQLRQMLQNVQQLQEQQKQKYVKPNQFKVPNINKKLINQQFVQNKINKKNKKETQNKPSQPNKNTKTQQKNLESQSKNLTQLEQKQEIKKRLKLSFLKKNLNINQMIQYQ